VLVLMLASKSPSMVYWPELEWLSSYLVPSSVNKCPFIMHIPSLDMWAYSLATSMEAVTRLSIMCRIHVPLQRLSAIIDSRSQQFASWILWITIKYSVSFGIVMSAVLFMYGICTKWYPNYLSQCLLLLRNVAVLLCSVSLVSWILSILP